MGGRVGVNGFGRIGRQALRAAWGWPELEFAHINEIGGDAAVSAHLLTFDSPHGRWAHEARGEGILGYETRPLVSMDFVTNPHSAIVDEACTMVTNGTRVKIDAWYDNEWGYANRYAELARKVALAL